jgi:hypothetical protein
MDSQTLSLIHIFFDFNDNGDYVWPEDDILKMEYLGVTSRQLCYLLLVNHQPVQHENGGDQCRCTRLLDNQHVQNLVCDRLNKYTMGCMQHYDRAWQKGVEVEEYVGGVGYMRDNDMHDKHCKCDVAIINQRNGEIATRNQRFDIYLYMNRFHLAAYRKKHFELWF